MKNLFRSPARTLVIGLLCILLASLMYSVQRYYVNYYLPRHEAVVKAEQQQDHLWLSAFDQLDLSKQQKLQIKEKLLQFDKDKHISRFAIANHQDQLHKTALSQASHQQKILAADENMQALYQSTVDLKKANFYHLREIYFKILTPKQQAEFLRENPVILEPKVILERQVKSQLPELFKGLKLSAKQNQQISKIVDINKMVDINYAKIITSYQIYSQQFMKKIDEQQIDQLFNQLYEDYLNAYNFHKQAYEKIYAQVFTEEQRESVQEPLSS